MLELFKKQPFFYLYIALISPSYVLPYVGSNSFIFNIFSSGQRTGFYIHLLTLGLAVLVTLIRGLLLKKPAIALLSFIAMCFDLIPLLNLIPLVPSAFHLLTLMAATNTRVDVAPNQFR